MGLGIETDNFYIEFRRREERFSTPFNDTTKKVKKQKKFSKKKKKGSK